LAGWRAPGPDWLHEIKFDGYRLHARLDNGAVRLLTRTGLDWTHKYPSIAAAISSLRSKQAYLDGELCGVRPDGTTSFSAIQAASDAGKSDALVFFLFDLLYLDGETLGSSPLIDRKARLQPWIRHGLAAHCRRAGCGRNGLLPRRRSCCPTPASLASEPGGSIFGSQRRYNLSRNFA
jgi:ATP-dependent DNA ligase